MLSTASSGPRSGSSSVPAPREPARRHRHRTRSGPAKCRGRRATSALLGSSGGRQSHVTGQRAPVEASVHLPGTGDVAQPGRAPGLQPGGRRFKSDRLHGRWSSSFRALSGLETRHVVGLLSLPVDFAGRGLRTHCGGFAGWGEGSNPIVSTDGGCPRCEPCSVSKLATWSVVLSACRLRRMGRAFTRCRRVAEAIGGRGETRSAVPFRPLRGPACRA